jgi:hypothetical protein
MDATTGRGDRGGARMHGEPASTPLRLCEPCDADLEATRDQLTTRLEHLREQLQAREDDQRRGAEELGRLRHEISLVRARLREAPPDDELGSPDTH